MPQLEHYAAKLVATWRETGPASVARDVANLCLRPWHDRQNRGFDRRHGLDTAPTEAEALVAPAVEHRPDGNATYWPTSPAMFRGVMAVLPRDVGRRTFVDFGSGKGRTLVLAAEHGFGRVIGVELSRELHEIALRNAAAYAARAPGRPAIELVNGDVLDFPIPGGPCVLYLYNPVTEPLLRRVLANIAASYLAAPRPMHLVYLAPRFPQAFEELGFLRVVARRRFALHSGIVYAAGPPNAREEVPAGGPAARVAARSPA